MRLIRPVCFLEEAQHACPDQPPPLMLASICLSSSAACPPYQIKNEAGELEPLGAAAVNAASDSEVEEMFDEVFGAE